MTGNRARPVPILASTLGAAAALLATLALAPPSSAAPAGVERATANSAAHQGARACGVHDCIYAYVDATAGGGAVTASATVKVAASPSAVARLQIDSVSIRTAYNTIAETGPRNLGNAAPVTQAVRASMNPHSCAIYQAVAAVSGRLSNGVLITGQVTSLPFTSTYASCPQLPAALTGTPTTNCTTVGEANGHAIEDCYAVQVRTARAPDGRHVYAVGSISARGRASDGFVRSSVDRVMLASTGGAASAVSSVNSGTLPTNQAVTIAARSFGLAPQSGCHDYTARIDFSLRLTNGGLHRQSLYSVTRVCA